MDFQAKLERIKQRVEGNLPPAYLKVMHEATAALERSGISARVLKAGQTAPSFELSDYKGNLISSQDLLKSGPLVVTFYRGVWCPYCNADLAELNHHLPEIEKRGASLIAISPDLPKFLSKVVLMQNLDFNILFDEQNKLAAQFGVKWTYSEDLKELYRDKLQINLEFNQGNPDWSVPLPSRFIIDQKGVIRYAESKVDYRERPNPDHMLAALKAL